jgi:hypothetical protein
MIQIFGPDKTIIGLFKDYDELFKHINTHENSKLTESSSCFPENIWSFVLFTNKRLSYIYYKTLEKSFSPVGRQAYEQELDLIEISKGDLQSPIQIPVTPDVNIEELKKNWCQEYCDSHDYCLVEYNHNFDNIPTNENLPAANFPNSSRDILKERYARVHAPL